jgi:hypothetical protein
MRILKTFVVTLILFSAPFVNSAFGQSFTLSGFVKDSLNGESIKGVQITEFISGATVSSNSYGFYSITLKTGTYNFRVNSADFEQKILSINLTKNLELNIELAPKAEDIGEVNVRAKKNDNVKKIDI